jgi:hypothetical protein
MHDLNPPSGPRAWRGGWTQLPVKGEGKLKARIPAALGETVAGALIVAFLPSILVAQAGWKLLDATILSIIVSLVLLVQFPFSLALRGQKAALLEFLARCGPETEILSSKAFCLDAYDIEVKTVANGAEHRFRYGFAPLGLRGPPYVYMIWPTTRKGISFQNQVRFNNFSKKFNTVEFSYLRNWTVRLFAYPTKGDLWWFDLYLFRGAKATAEHLWECYQIALETKDKLTRPNPAF